MPSRSAPQRCAAYLTLRGPRQLTHQPSILDRKIGGAGQLLSLKACTLNPYVQAVLAHTDVLGDVLHGVATINSLAHSFGLEPACIPGSRTSHFECLLRVFEALGVYVLK
jgi:hypothetical protein